MKLDAKQRETAASIIADIGKLTFAGLVIGKFISPEAIPLAVFLTGLIFSIVCFLIAVLISAERSKT